jgi:ATP-binding cassette subfamily B protein
MISDTSEPGRVPFPKTPIAFTWWLTRKVPRRAFLLLAITVVGTALQALAPYAIGGMIDVVEQRRFEAVAGWFAFLIVAWLVGPAITRLYTLANAFTIPRMRAIADRALFLHTLGQAARFFNESFVGSISQRIRRGANTAPNLFEMAVLPFASIAVNVAVSAVLLALASPSYAVAFLVFGLFFGVVTVPMARLVVARTHAMARARSRLTGRIADTVANADVVRSYAGWHAEEAGFDVLSEDEYRKARAVRIALTGLRLTQLLLSVGFLALVVWFALDAAQSGRASAGEIAMILTVGVQISLAITQLGDNVLHVFELVGELQESLNALAVPHEIPDPPGARRLEVGGGRVALENLSFAYADGTVVFDRLNLTIGPGEKVGLVGRSGAGKSTLIKLITRRYIPTGGRVTIDGMDVATTTLESLAMAIAEVPQTTELFHRSIADNIRYGRPSAGDEEVDAAARAAGAHEFIEKRIGGYGAVVGERGVKLSGGERQRVAVARAFLKDAPILILDEATAALDTETELVLQRALWRLMRGRTVIAIAHRLSTLKAMDRIVVFEAGRIVEEGRPADLIAADGVFARVWALQHQTEPVLQAAD